MSWECANRRICECGHFNWDFPLLEYTSARSRLHYGYENKRGESPHKDWIILIQEYSRRSLTQETDKLVAISRIAKIIADKLYKIETPTFETDFSESSLETEGSELSSVSSTSSKEEVENASASGIVHNILTDIYKAGLWRDTFVVDLSWRVVEPGHHKTKDDRASYLAPTWSWASVNKTVRYDYFLSKELGEPLVDILCTVEDVISEAVLASDPTGSLKDGYAILTGELVCVELVVLDDDLSDLWYLDSYKPYIAEDSTQPKVLVRAQNLFSVEIFLDQPRESSTVKTLSKSDDESYIHHRAKGDDEWFLVLQKSLEIEATFERIGIGVWNSRCDRRVEDDTSSPLFDEYVLDTITIR